MTDKYVRDFGVNVNDEKIFSFTNDVKNIIEDDVHSKKLEGIQIIIPSAIDVDKSESLPLIWLTSFSGYRLWQVIEKQNTHLLITNLDDGLAKVFYAYPTKKRRNPHFMGFSASGSPPENAKTSRGTGIVSWDVRALTGIGWGNGRYALTMLMYDWRSNTEITKLVSAKSDTTPEWAFSGNPNSVILYQGDEKFGQVGTATVRDKDGVKAELTIPDSIGMNDQSLSGSVAYHVSKDNIFEITNKTEAGKTPTLVFSLVFTLLDEKQPYTYNMTVPLKDSQVVLGKSISIPFKINIESLLSDAASQKLQMSQVYFVAGSHVSGPTAITLKQ